MSRKIGIFISLIILILGIVIVGRWGYRQLKVYREGDTLADISLKNLKEGTYVSFDVNEALLPVGEEYSWGTRTYISDGTEYEIYTMVVQVSKNQKKRIYIQVMVSDQETKDKLKKLEQGKVHFQGVVIDTPMGLNEYYENDYEGITDENGVKHNFLVTDMTIKQTTLPDERGDLVKGVLMVIAAFICYHMLGGIKACIPAVVIEANSYAEYKFEYSLILHNVNNELELEKDTLKKLQEEQAQNKVVSNILIAIFFIGLIILIRVPVFFIRIFGLVPMFIGMGGFWSRYSNSSSRLPVYLAHKRGKRSIYLEIEKCKKNIVELEGIIEKKNKENFEEIMDKKNLSNDDN